MVKALSERTEAYFKAIREEKGYVGCNNGWDGIQEILNKKCPGVTAEVVTTYDGYMDSSEMKVYSYQANGRERYCAELSYRTAIDDYNIETHIFDKLPSRQDVIDMRDLDDLEFSIKYNGLEQEFTCWECGIQTHWLDIPGTLRDKINGVKERYCGC